MANGMDERCVIQHFNAARYTSKMEDSIDGPSVLPCVMNDIKVGVCEVQCKKKKKGCSETGLMH